MFGKEAYETASTIANEAMSNIRTVMSLNAEPTVRFAFCNERNIFIIFARSHVFLWIESL